MSFAYLTDPDTIHHAFPPAFLERGRRYARDGNVLSADLDAARGTLVGRVRGSGGRLYQCVVQVVVRADAAPRLIARCSCPVGLNCKHAAAMLLSLAERRPPAETPVPAANLPMELRGWLNRAELLASRIAATDSPYWILYLLHDEPQYGVGSTTVQAVKARRLAEGGWGKPQDFNILGTSRADFVRPEDLRIMALARAGSRNDASRARARLDEYTGADVLRAIVLSGRGYHGQPDGPALRYAGPLSGRLAWHLDPDARMRVALESERSGLRLLALTPPWYLDPESGDCGPVESGLDDREAALLAMAPAVPAEAAEDLERAAETRVKGLRLPLPRRPPRQSVQAAPPTPCLHLRSEDLARTETTRYWGLRREPQWVHAAVLLFDYGGAPVDPRDRGATLQRVEDGRLLVVERDAGAERAAIERLGQMGFAPGGEPAERPGLAFALEDETAWFVFMGRHLPALQASGWRI